MTMQLRLLAIFVTVSLFIFPVVVRAEEGSSTPKPITPKQNNEIRKDRTEIKKDNQEIRKDKQELRQDNKNKDSKELQKDLNALKEDKAKQLEDRKKLLADEKSARDNFKSSVEAKIAKAKEETKIKRVELKRKLEAIKDERKKAVVEKIDAGISELNSKRTAQMTENINKIASVLEKAVNRAVNLRSSGTNLTEFDSKVAAAKTAIAAAQQAISIQAGKEYAISVSSETKLKVDVGTTMQNLKTNLSATQQQVAAARQAVGQAIQELETARKTQTLTPKETPAVTPGL